MIDALKKGSFWLSMLEQVVYIAPTLGTVLYYYFTSIEQTISRSSKYSFAMAICLLVVFIIYKAVAAKKLAELRASVVQTETDLRNTPDTKVEERAMLALNAKKDRRKLDMCDRASIMITLLIIAISISILEKALIGLTMLSYIALGSVLAGFGLRLGVLELKSKEALKPAMTKRGDKHV